jgi:hypothetical protein
MNSPPPGKEDLYAGFRRLTSGSAAPEIYTRSNATGNTKHYVNSVLLRESIPGPGSGNTVGGFR